MSLYISKNPYNLLFFKGLSSKVENGLFGQPLAVKTIVNSFKAHFSTDEPKKALVLSFHGSTGTGKTHTANLVVASLFK